MIGKKKNLKRKKKKNNRGSDMEGKKNKKEVTGNSTE